jgi:hypothetical protein
LGSLLNTDVAGTGNPAQVVYDHLKEDVAGQSPVVCVASQGFLPHQLSFGDDHNDDWAGEYRFMIFIFVAREDEEVAEDALDDTIEAVFQVLAENRSYSTYWKKIEFGAPSEVTTIAMGGDPYWMEVLPITVGSY